jgi:nucleotide-binding universal stress UspA family protein
MRRVLIATDGSPSALEAVRFGLELAHEHEADVTFVHAVRATDWAAGSALGPMGAMPHEPTEADAEPLRAAVALAEELGVHADSKVLVGRPVDEIVAYADTIDADVIVVGSRGHGTVSTVLLGSVSLGVLHEAHRPVLVARGRPRPGTTPAAAAASSYVDSER